MTARRFPLGALVAASGLSEAAFARSVGLSGTTLKLARQNGLVADAADRYAVRAGFAPLEVWPDYGMVPCAECGTLFAPARGGRFCRVRCYQNQYQRAWRRKREATDPDFYKMRREGTAAWRERSRRGKRIKDRAYYERNREAILAKARARYHAKKSAEVPSSASHPAAGLVA